MSWLNKLFWIWIYPFSGYKEGKTFVQYLQDCQTNQSLRKQFLTVFPILWQNIQSSSLERSQSDLNIKGAAHQTHRQSRPVNNSWTCLPGVPLIAQHSTQRSLTRPFMYGSYEFSFNSCTPKTVTLTLYTCRSIS